MRNKDEKNFKRNWNSYRYFEVNDTCSSCFQDDSRVCYVFIDELITNGTLFFVKFFRELYQIEILRENKFERNEILMKLNSDFKLNDQLFFWF